MKKQQFEGTTCQKWVWHSHVQKPISTAHALEGGVACTAVIVQSLEVNTTKKTQPWSHSKQTNTKTTFHDKSSLMWWWTWLNFHTFSPADLQSSHPDSLKPQKKHDTNNKLLWHFCREEVKLSKMQNHVGEHILHSLHGADDMKLKHIRNKERESSYRRTKYKWKRINCSRLEKTLVDQPIQSHYTYDTLKRMCTLGV